MALDPRQAIASFISKGNSNISEKGGIAYDNPKQNIDPNILTKVLTAKELVIADHGSVQYLKSGMLFVSGSNLFIANSPTSITQLGAASSGSGDVATDVIWDAKGDLAVGTGTDTASKLAVGVTSGMVLAVDSSTATGLKWATASGTDTDKAYVGSGLSFESSGGDTSYGSIWTGSFSVEADAQNTFPRACTFQKMSCHVWVNDLTTASTWRFRVNAANGNRTITINSTTTGIFTDVTNTDTIAANDEISWSFVAGGAGTLLASAFQQWEVIII